MSPDHITAGAYNRDIDKRLARIWSGYARLTRALRGTPSGPKYPLRRLSTRQPSSEASRGVGTGLTYAPVAGPKF